jgi:hypothetical protein
VVGHGAGGEAEDGGSSGCENGGLHSSGGVGRDIS